MPCAPNGRYSSCWATEFAAQDERVYDFPAAKNLALVNVESLKPLKITNGRIGQIIQLSKAVCSGRLQLESIAALDLESAYVQLKSISGVGHWTAANVLGRALGQYPYVSHNDVALQSAVHHYFCLGVEKKSAQQVMDTLSPYGRYAGLVGHFVLLRWVLDCYPVAAGSN